MAQWLTRLITAMSIPGSNHTAVTSFYFIVINYCIQDTLSSRALSLVAECARKQRYLAYKINSETIKLINKFLKIFKIKIMQILVIF